MRKQIQVPLGTFSKNLDEELQARMEIGIVDFNFVITTDSAAEPKGSTRHARGTRNLSFDFIPFDAIPMGLRTPPDWVCTFYDVDRGGWRCFVRSALINILDKIEIEE